MRDLISTFKKKVQSGNELSTILPKSSDARKKPAAPAQWETGVLVTVNVSRALVSRRGSAVPWGDDRRRMSQGSLSVRQG